MGIDSWILRYLITIGQFPYFIRSNEFERKSFFQFHFFSKKSFFQGARSW